MTNWDKLRHFCSLVDLARWLEKELGDSTPVDWVEWLTEEALA